MIVIRIEVWPRGDARGLRQIKRLTIVNIGEAPEGYHLYEARDSDRVVRFRHRRSQGPEVLLTVAFAALLERGEPDPLSAAADDEEYADAWPPFDG